MLLSFAILCILGSSKGHLQHIKAIKLWQFGYQINQVSSSLALQCKIHNFMSYKISSSIFCFICSGILQGVNEKNWTTFIHTPCLHIALAPINYRRIVFLFWDTCQIFQISKKYDEHFTRAWVKWNNPRALWEFDLTVGWSINGIAKKLMASQSILFVNFSVFFLPDFV